MARCSGGLAFLLLIGALSARPTFSQDRVIRIPEAESLFQAAVADFEAGRFTQSAGEFSQVADGFPLHQHTTAAAFMQARSLYRLGSYDRAAALYEAFLARYPDSRYRSEAERALRLARQARDAEASQPITLGIVLSLGAEEAAPSQQLFNGIRIAVEDHNAGRRGRPVRMLFRDIEALGVARAVASATEDGATLIIGALYSDQALVAAETAERLGVTFIAPLATDDRVALDRQFTFQANPSISMRGRLMARFAVNGLRQDEVAVIAERDDRDISEQMGLAFADEARALGATVHFTRILTSQRDWLRIGQDLTMDELDGVGAIYAPLAGDRADRLAGGLLAGLDQLLGTTEGELAPIRVLGNAEWHNIPVRAAASRYLVTYTNDYYLDPTALSSQAFTRRYRTLTSQEPGRLAVVGHDLTQYVIETAQTLDRTAVPGLLLSAPLFQGIGMRIHFGGEHVNDAMFYHRYRDGVLELVR